jgi:ribosomal protein L34E
LTNKNRLRGVKMDSTLPEGYWELPVTKVYTNGKQLVITGLPGPEHKKHDCDKLGCTELGHILLKGVIKSKEMRVQSKQYKTKSRPMPPCLGHTSGNPTDGYDYDCDYENAPDCENCLCNFYITGGSIDPRTGKQVKVFKEENDGDSG